MTDRRIPIYFISTVIGKYLHLQLFPSTQRYDEQCVSTVQSTSIPQNPRAPVDQISAHLRGPREKVGVFDVKVGAFDVMIP
jgi:hypothetical protein